MSIQQHHLDAIYVVRATALPCDVAARGSQPGEQTGFQILLAWQRSTTAFLAECSQALLPAYCVPTSMCGIFQPNKGTKTRIRSAVLLVGT